MKRLVALIIVLNGITGAALFAQNNNHYPLRITGTGGFGFGQTNIQSGNFFNSKFQDLSSELGLDARGYVYDPRFLNYTLSAYWDGNNTAIDQGSARSNGLSFTGALSFLPERSFPFTFYFSRSHSNAAGSLIPPFSTNNTIFGLRGDLKKPRLAMISYNLGMGRTENDLPTGEIFNTRHRFANLSATRKVVGWDLRFGEDYLRTISTFSNFLDRNNTLSFDASRAYGDRIRVDVGAAYTAFAFTDLTGANSSNSAVALVNGNVTWKHTERLDSFYTFNFSRNAVNMLRALAAANRIPGTTLPFNALSLDSSSENLAAGANYRPTSRLSFNANLGYSHNGLPRQTLESLTPLGRKVFTTDVFNADAGYTYRRRVWKLEFNNASSLNWQRFILLSGDSDSGLGFSLHNGITGGDVRKARFSAFYRYNRRSNPIFFNVVTTSDRRATLKVDSEYLRFVTLQALADIGKTKLDLAGSTINLDTSNYMFSAVFRRLNLFASRGVSDSAERFFGPDSILFQPGGSTGGLPLPGLLLNPLIFSNVLSERVGLAWRPRRNLEVESRLSRNQYLFTFLNEVENRYKQFDTTVNYKFGRFTIAMGFGRAGGDSLRFHQKVNRVFLRVRFPFRVL